MTGLESEVYSEPCQTSKMECFAKIVSGWKSLTIFAKYSIFVVVTSITGNILLEIPQMID